MKDLRYEGKVAVITGAGNGLGRSHALLLGSRGAKVVVNDLGGDAFGGGKGSAAADKVVEEIKAAGGEAVANYDSVEDGGKIVQTALDAFGRLDILVNNAGILRDKSFHKMTEEDWDLIYRVHVLGSFRVTHAAWPVMREQQYGRIVMTASAAGIYGNFGQANYGMAKLGLVGLANTLAREGLGRNIHVNAIAPIAGSRLTETVLPQELIDVLKPEYVSPMVAYLCHESCEETGGLFELGGGYYSKLRWERTKGKTYRVGRAVTPESVKSAWSEITSFEGSENPADITSSMAPILTNLQAGESKGGNEYIDVDAALGYEFPEMTTSYDERDVAIYALGVGAAADPKDDVELQQVYELHQDGMKVLPTFGVIPAINTMLERAKKGETPPGVNYSLDRLLHGEQYTELKRPLPKKGTLTHRSKITDIFDKGKNAVMVTETRSFDEDGEELVVNRFKAVIRGCGGWGGDRGPADEENAPPDRKPDATAEQVISANQALLYRLSGDWNPLHADPMMAMAFGFEKPILHGLCTYGYVARHVINAFCGGDPRYFKSIKVRFADSVYPGETIITEMWKESDTRIVLRAKVKERDKDVITKAAVELFTEIPKPAPKKKEAPKAEEAPADEHTSADVFVAMRDHVERNPDLVGTVGTIYQFKLTDPDSAWTLDLKNGKGSVQPSGDEKADCVLQLSDQDFMDMTSGAADPQQLYFKGKLKISGNVMASQKLTFLQEIDPEQAKEAVMKARAEGTPQAAAQPTKAKESRAQEIFGALEKRINENPGLVAEVQAVVQFTVIEPDAEWVVDLKNGEGAVKSGRNANADAVLTIEQDDLIDLIGGKSSAQMLYQQGKLRVDGDISVAHRLGFLKGLV